MSKKTNTGLVEYAKAQLGLPYWYGCFGQTATASLYNSKKKQYPQYYNPSSYKTGWSHQYGKRVHDCVGLIKGYLWSDSATSKPVYKSSQDTSANGMLTKCKEKGKIKTIPEIPGVLVFFSGHVGVYEGNGYVIEARGHDYGVVRTKLSARPWTDWGKCPYITYETSGASATTKPTAKPVTNTSKPTTKSNLIKEWQKAAMADGFKPPKYFAKYGVDGDWGSECEAVAKKATCKKLVVGYKYKNLTKIIQKVVGVKADGKFGNSTKNAVISYQKKKGLTADGVVGLNTWKKILGV